MCAGTIDKKPGGAGAQAIRVAEEMLSRFGESATLTAEFRLWWPNNQIEMMARWLDEKGILLGEPVERTDIYCRTGNPELNIKRRGGEQLEMKSYAGELQLVDCIAGEDHGEYWIKQMLEGHEISTRGGIAVKKKRWLSCLTPDGEYSESKKPSGCQIELGEVRTENRPQIWTSLCLEAFGEPKMVTNSLNAALQKLGDPPSVNERPLVASYAAWLFHKGYFGSK